MSSLIETRWRNMAKVLKKGIKNSGNSWVGKRVKCDECGGCFKVQVSDKVKKVEMFSVDSNSYTYYYTIKCPTKGCGNSIDFD